jgi:sterol desaturase/sphingolipid hydroxylase (fatty acid hydroxylase superfamily)
MTEVAMTGSEAVRGLRYLPVVVVGLFAALFAVERYFPLRKARVALLARLAVNLVFSGLAFLTAMAVVKPATLGALHWAGEKPFGLLHVLPVPAWAQAIVGFMLLDLSFYYWHVLNHQVPVLWRFHNVHHIDPDLDVSTGFRFHFGEVLLSTLFRIAQVSLLGIPFTTFAAYELVFQANTLFHHSNVRLPIRFERLLNAFLVTPRMHGIHHSQVRRETNSNYGVVFCWWDKVHRTLGLNIPQAQIEIGVAGYSAPDDNQLWHILSLPFRRQRDYWHRPDGTRPQRDPLLESDRSRLAE